MSDAYNKVALPRPLPDPTDIQPVKYCKKCVRIVRKCDGSGRP